MSREAPELMLIDVWLMAPVLVNVRAPPVIPSVVPDKVPETLKAPVLTAFAWRLPETVPPLRVAPFVAVNTADPARVPVPFC